MTTTHQETAVQVEAGSLRLTGIEKAYDLRHPEQKAVQDVSVEIPAGRFVTLLGPSGCGKTTTLRMIAGFEDPTAGDILVDGSSVLRVAPEKRPMSMVFQSYALFPHLTVRDNVAFGLKIKKLPRSRRQAKVTEGLRMMGIEKFADRYPRQLSGGQQQRVPLARALVMEPKIVLFDEPLSNLDARLRVKMREEIRALQQRLGLTAIFVTHDQSEAMTLSDIVVVMSEGRIEQIGSPTDIYHRPVNHYVASFLGTSTFVPGTVVELSDEADGSRYVVDSGLGRRSVRGTPGLATGADVEIVVRREGAHVVDPDRAPIEGVVEAAAFDGSVIHYTVATALGSVAAQAPGDEQMREVGTRVGISVSAESLWTVPAAGERA